MPRNQHRPGRHLPAHVRPLASVAALPPADQLQRVKGQRQGGAAAPQAAPPALHQLDVSAGVQLHGALDGGCPAAAGRGAGCVLSALAVV